MNTQKSDINVDIFKNEYLEPVHKVGFWTSIGVSIAMLLPTIFLLVFFEVFPPTSAIWKGLLLGFTYSIPFFFIEPIAYYAIYGDAGNYMSMTSGNISNLRLPCAAVAQEVAGVQEGTRVGNLIATIGIAVSIILGVLGVFLGAIATGWISNFFSDWVKDAFSTYLLPAVFGAVFGQFTLRGWKYAPVALVLSIIPMFFNAPAYITIPIAVFGTIIFGRIAYTNWGWGKPKSFVTEELPDVEKA
ncbi:MAG: hypothetical protein JW908_13465 [Anaerolineales bacterium]|nr:hypothetical protein [Anaerolineales bacterium]